MGKLSKNPENSGSFFKIIENLPGLFFSVFVSYSLGTNCSEYLA